jgi:hypothetical protein
VTAPIVLPWPLRSGFEAATRALFDLGDLTLIFPSKDDTDV